MKQKLVSVQVRFEPKTIKELKRRCVLSTLKPSLAQLVSSMVQERLDMDMNGSKP